MKKFLIYGLTFLLSVFPALGQQGNITTRKLKISDFTTKVTRVVLTGNEMFDLPYRAEINSRWTASPYEFCSLSEYEASKTNQNYYFLVCEPVRFHKESAPGILFLTLFKGGEEKASDSNKNLVEVVSMPFCASKFSSGREFTYLPAYIDVIQDFALKAMLSDRVGYSGLTSYGRRLSRFRSCDVLISEDDLRENVRIDDEWAARGVRICAEDEVDEAFSSGDSGVISAYCVAPSEPEKGSRCYILLFRADTHELCLFDSFTASSDDKIGFGAKQLKFISALKKKKK